MIAEAPLVDLRTRDLVPRAKEIFAEWYEKYKDKHSGLMDNASISRFIYGSTKTPCSKDDQRVKNIIDKYDSDKDGAITLTEFW